MNSYVCVAATYTHTPTTTTCFDSRFDSIVNRERDISNMCVLQQHTHTRRVCLCVLLQHKDVTIAATYTCRIPRFFGRACVCALRQRLNKSSNNKAIMASIDLR